LSSTDGHTNASYTYADCYSDSHSNGYSDGYGYSNCDLYS